MSLEVRDGSVKTLLTISLPLILSFLSMLGMLTVDRLFLARYSTDALSAAVSGGMTAWALTFGGQTLTNVSGIFAAQYNGSKQYLMMGKPVWQMIWLSLFFIIPFGAAAIWFAPWAFAGSPIETEQVLYYRLTMAISPFMCLLGGLNGFFIGQGKTSIITWLTLLGNLINLILDPILIFGYGPVPSMGIMGACLATGIGLICQNGVMLYLFLKRENRETFGTNEWIPDLRAVWEMVKIGGPEALAAILELGAWAALYLLLNDLGAVHILVTSVGQSILMSMFFFGIGLEQGISSVSGNLIGLGRKGEVMTAFLSGCKIVAVFGISLMAFLWLGSEWIVDLFLQDPERLEGAERLSSLTSEELAIARNYVIKSSLVIGAYIIIENIRCLLYGILRSAGDTFFILVTSIATTWLLLLAPTYLLMTLWKMPVDTSFWIWLTFAAASTSICYARFAQGSWAKKQTISLLKTRDDEALTFSDSRTNFSH
ncbi:MATE family efflux transporter [Waddlia chondrophila]|uniref:Multidrug-efflux transporter n=1 Tax=Waddlia chondrophila (strain ATCC VR-1470 / WSU 86-1044) TaxID=716544 RepID=D6YRX3_WADCW|nr:MATE family efflux transporter [Waddlia chondrophila]ADI38818.1 putative multidrug resistance protein [Waddlia chondrophila WSU 86-1044]